METLKPLDSLPEAQQKALDVILRMKKTAFRTSEIAANMPDSTSGHSVGGTVGALFRNGYLQRLQGSRDKKWKLSEAANKSKKAIQNELNELKQYWS